MSSPADVGDVTLRPAEDMALTVALAQLDRSELSPNVAAMCVLALGRVARGIDYDPAATA